MRGTARGSFRFGMVIGVLCLLGPLAAFGEETQDRKPFGVKTFLVALAVLAAGGLAAEVGSRFLGSAAREKSAETQVPPPVGGREGGTFPSLSLPHKDPARNAEYVLEKLLEVPGIHLAALYRMNGDGKWVIVSSRGLSPAYQKEREVLAQVAREPHGKTRIWDFIGLMNGSGNEPELLEGIRCLGEIPVFHEGRMSGLLKVGSRSASFFPTELTAEIETKAQLLGPLIEQAAFSAR